MSEYLPCLNDKLLPGDRFDALEKNGQVCGAILRRGALKYLQILLRFLQNELRGISAYVPCQHPGTNGGQRNHQHDHDTLSKLTTTSRKIDVKPHSQVFDVTRYIRKGLLLG